MRDVNLLRQVIILVFLANNCFNIYNKYPSPHTYSLFVAAAGLRCPKPDQINAALLSKFSYRSSVRHHCGRLWWPLVGVLGRRHGGVSVVVIYSRVVTDHPGPRRCSGFVPWPPSLLLARRRPHNTSSHSCTQQGPLLACPSPACITT